MNSSEENTTNQNPSPGKYEKELNDKTKNLEESTSDQKEIHPLSKDFTEEGPIESNSDLNNNLIDQETDITQQEINDLDHSATRMPGEEDDFLDGEKLVDEDNEGVELNEGDDPLGEDLDIPPEDKDANEYDNITE